MSRSARPICDCTETMNFERLLLLYYSKTQSTTAAREFAMSDMYSIRVEEITQGTLEEILADGVEHKMQQAALERVLLHGGEDESYSALTLQIAEDHPDAWPLNQRTAGLMLFLLADTSEAITEALGGFDHINSNNLIPDQTNTPVAYRVLEVSEEERRVMKVRVWCATRYAPNPDDKYSSTAWGIDDHRVKTEAFVLNFGDRFPAPGLAGNFGPPSVLAFDFPAGQYSVDLAAAGNDRVVFLTTPGGRRLYSDAPFEKVEILDDTPLRAKTTNYQTLLFSEGKLFAETRPPKGGPGKFSSFDPKTGELIDKNAKEPEGPVMKWIPDVDPLVFGDTEYTVEDGYLVATKTGTDEELWRQEVDFLVKGMSRLSITPDKNTIVIFQRSTNYLFDLESKSVALSFKIHDLPFAITPDGNYMFTRKTQLGNGLVVWKGSN